MRKTGVVFWTALGALLLVGGCFHATIPSDMNIGPSSPPPPSYVGPGDPNSSTDLLRENQQLRERMAWLESDNRKLAKKYDGLAGDMADIRRDMDKARAERDRYLKALGR